MPQLECDLLAVFRHAPRFRQFGFEVLRLAVGANQHAAGQIANGHGSIVIDQRRVESLRLRAQAEPQFTAVLREGEGGEQKETDQQLQKCAADGFVHIHAVTSSFDKSI